MSSTIENSWETKAGYRAVCLFVDGSHRCGYVGIDEGHPLHGSDYGDKTPLLKLSRDEPLGSRGIFPTLLMTEADFDEGTSPDCYFDVHGGITYSDGSEGYPEAHDGLWWFGFDCAHSGDATAYSSFPGDVERTQEFVEAECEKLAEALAGVARVAAAA